jgi:hypothetical protein
MASRESGISEVVATILVVFLVIALAVVVGVLLFGWALPLQKTAYIAMEVSPRNISNASVVQVFHGQGDTVSLAPSKIHGVPVRFVLTNGSATYHATPLPAAASQGFGPGATLFLFRNASGVWLSDNRSDIGGNLGFAPGEWTISLIDTSANVLIARDTVQLSSAVVPVYPRFPGFTVESWVKWTVPPNPGSDATRMWAMIVVDGNSDSNRVYQIGHNQMNDRFEFRIRMTNNQEGLIMSDTAPQAGVWYYVAEVYNQTPGTFTIYVNGNPETGIGTWSPDSGGIHSSTGMYQAGGPAGISYNGAANQRRFNGEILGLSRYTNALSPQEILAHYQAGVL